MAKKKKKKGIFRSAFYRVYFALVILALVGIAIGTHWLRGVLADYESALPVHVAQDVAELFEEGDFERLYALDTSANEIAEGDRDFYVQSLSEVARGRDVRWWESAAEDDAHRYTVTLDGERFATFTLVPSGETTKRGTRLWKLGSVTTHVAVERPEPEPTVEPEPETPVEYYECRVTVPQGYVVTVDGTQLSAETAMITPRPIFEDGFLPPGIQSPMRDEYIYYATQPQPQITVTDETGAAVALDASTERERAWSCMPREDEAFRDQYSGAALSLGKSIARYTSQDGSKKAVTRNIAKGSPADEIFDNHSNRYTTPHSSVSFRNESVSQFYVLSENCFTCRVTFDFVMKTTDGERVFPTAYTFCVINQNGKGKLYNLLTY